MCVYALNIKRRYGRVDVCVCQLHSPVDSYLCVYVYIYHMCAVHGSEGSSASPVNIMNPINIVRMSKQIYVQYMFDDIK